MVGHGDEDWHLREWMAHLGKRQASLVNELGWTKNRANIVWHGRQPYKRSLVNEISRWLGIRPYELLMAPREAEALRRLRQSAAVIAAEEEGPAFDTEHAPAAPFRRRA
jgi:transcriptional regulator with XRE-family HTH domain